MDAHHCSSVFQVTHRSDNWISDLLVICIYIMKMHVENAKRMEQKATKQHRRKQKRKKKWEIHTGNKQNSEKHHVQCKHMNMEHKQNLYTSSYGIFKAWIGEFVLSFYAFTSSSAEFQLKHIIMCILDSFIFFPFTDFNSNTDL